MTSSAKAPGDAYSHGAIGFHWLTAAIVLTIIPVGIAMNAVEPGPTMSNPVQPCLRPAGEPE